uniref:Uncharacterized protein n=1 Tax=Mus spicilegus TaxID=10103 RepID=A0A8C6GMU8_MUSSI
MQNLHSLPQNKMLKISRAWCDTEEAFQPLTEAYNRGSNLETHTECFASAKIFWLEGIALFIYTLPMNILRAVD